MHRNQIMPLQTLCMCYNGTVNDGQKHMAVTNIDIRTGGLMKLDRENMRKLKELILFTIIILIALWNYKII